MRRMRSFSFLLIAALGAGCGTSPDERPVSFEFVTLGILAPTCGQVQCHSTTTKTAGYAFDTLAASREALTTLTDDRSADSSKLIEVMTASGGSRMPPDSPLNEEDITLVKLWIDDGRMGL